MNDKTNSVNTQAPASEAIDENHIIAERRAKLAEWRATGKAYPNDFERENISGKIIEVYDSKTAEELDALYVREDSTYGDLRLTSVYSHTGLSTQTPGSINSASGTGSTNYVPMDMR